MAKKKGNLLVLLVGEGYQSIRKSSKDKKLNLKKYSRKLRKHVECKEKKLS